MTHSEYSGSPKLHFRKGPGSCTGNPRHQGTNFTLTYCSHLSAFMRVEKSQKIYNSISSLLVIFLKNSHPLKVQLTIPMQMSMIQMAMPTPKERKEKKTIENKTQVIYLTNAPTFIYECHYQFTTHEVLKSHIFLYL